MSVRFTRGAEADLESIGDYIARRNPARALTFVQDLRRCCLDLAGHPEMYPLANRYAHLAVRRRVHGAYLIFYRVSDGSVTILHVLHSARDIDDALFDP